jgi:hypothetical protein
VRDRSRRARSWISRKSCLTREATQTSPNADIAVDVSALTVDGGMLVYGVGEGNVDRLSCRGAFDWGPWD